MCGSVGVGVSSSPFSFRDYVRSHAEVAVRYAELKRELVERYRDNRHGYTNPNSPFLWATMVEQASGPSPSAESPDNRTLEPDGLWQMGFLCGTEPQHRLSQTRRVRWFRFFNSQARCIY